MFDKWTAVFDFVSKIVEVTPDVIADLQRLLDDAKRIVVGDAPDPTNPAELVALMQEGNRRVQDAPRFLVNELAKRISAATTAVVTEDETFAAAILLSL